MNKSCLSYSAGRKGRVREVKIAGVRLGGRREVAFIAGPCVIESERSTLRHAEKLKKIFEKAKTPFIFKSSYDKANRTSSRSFRGAGLKKGLEILAKIKKELGLAVLSDVHSQEEVGEASGVLDCLQIPAFLCRQTDLVLAAAKTGKPVNVKKGQFLAPWDMQQVVRKIEATGNRSILLTERGSCFGYNNLVVDFRGLAVMRQCGYPVIFDATHSVQLPGAMGGSSGGQRQYVAALSRAAVAIGCDALFLEVHQAPSRAPCDGANMISMASLPGFLEMVKRYSRLSKKR